MHTEARRSVAEAILGALTKLESGSSAVLRGSLADGRADRYSDIDVLWEVPDEQFDEAVAHVGDVLQSIAPLESIRSDPDFQHSEKRRLLYVRFQDMPLFWRLDLDIFARSVRRDDSYDRANTAARGLAWSPTESALMNVVAGVKAHYRQDDERGRELLLRGYQRVGLRPGRERLPDQMVELTTGIRVLDPTMHELAERVLQLIADAFPS